MKALLLSLALLVSTAATAAAQCPKCGKFHPPYDRPAVAGQIVSNSAAQNKANRMASTGRMSHAGPLAGPYEGVGFSTRSADSAIRACCYWGRRTPIAIGVARGARGWYACVGYR